MLMYITFSTYLTIARIIASPFIALLLVYQYWHAAFIVFTLAALTDFFDGFLARRWEEETYLGKRLDPLADKVLLLTTFLSLYHVQHVQSIPQWFIIVLFCKDLSLILGGIWLSLFHVMTLSPSWIAKMITTLEMIFLCYLILLYSGMIAYQLNVELCVEFFTYAFVVILFDYTFKAYKKIVERNS